MQYVDQLYGEWEVSDLIARLMRTREAARARKITQSVMPNYMIPDGPIPSRFQHNMGVCFLASLVVRANPGLPDDLKLKLPIYAFCHDLGNPALSHLSEPFLKEMLGHDSESFLANILPGSETEKILKEHAIDIEEVIRFVTGEAKPLAEVIHGSMDIDNLDNVARYGKAACFPVETFDGALIASSFRFDDNRWTLDGRCFEETKKWQAARKTVYNILYGWPHLNLATMIYRALEIAYCANEIHPGFFHMADEEAIEYLGSACNERTGILIERATNWDWYEEIVSLNYGELPKKLEEMPANWRGRKKMADLIAREFKLPEHEVLVYAGKGKDKRKITLPFTGGHGGFFDESNNSPIYRVKVYVPRERFGKGLEKPVLEFVKAMVE